jgi:hypothetical protein
VSHRVARPGEVTKCLLAERTNNRHHISTVRNGRVWTLAESPAKGHRQ